MGRCGQSDNQDQGPFSVSGLEKAQTTLSQS